MTIGVVSIDQALPFHESASIEPGVCTLEYQPTTVHAVAEVQDAPDTVPRPGLDFQLGTGTAGKATHDVPFQVCTAGPPVAIQNVDETHDTSSVPPYGLPAVLQLVPFQLAAPPEPTDMQNAAETQESAAKPLRPAVAAGLRRLHLVPFQISAMLL
jgi:hypothetical protein